MTAHLYEKFLNIIQNVWSPGTARIYAEITLFKEIKNNFFRQIYKRIQNTFIMTEKSSVFLNIRKNIKRPY